MHIMFGLDGLTMLAMLVGALWLGVRLVQRVPFWRAVLQAALAGYAAALLAVTLLEYAGQGLVGFDSAWRFINLIPLRTILELARPEHMHQAVRQLLGNVVMFIPLGMLLPAVAARYRRPGALLLAAACVSAGIELAQFALRFVGLPGRSVDVDDVILNVLGAAVGYFVWRAFALLIRHFSPLTEVVAAAEQE